MRVFSSVSVGVVVVVLEMFVLVAGVRMRVFSSVGVGVIVGVRFVVTVSMVCHCRLLYGEIPAVSIVLSLGDPWEQPGPSGLTLSIWSATLAAAGV